MLFWCFLSERPLGRVFDFIGGKYVYVGLHHRASNTDCLTCLFTALREGREGYWLFFQYYSNRTHASNTIFAMLRWSPGFDEALFRFTFHNLAKRLSYKNMTVCTPNIPTLYNHFVFPSQTSSLAMCKWKGRREGKGRIYLSRIMVESFGSKSVSTSGPPPFFQNFKMTFARIELGAFSLENESPRQTSQSVILILRW